MKAENISKTALSGYIPHYIFDQFTHALVVISAGPWEFPGPSLIYANKKFLKLVKLKARDIDKITLYTLDSLLTCSQLITKLRLAESKAQAITFKLSVPCSKKDVIKMETAIIPLFNEHNMLTSFILTLKDKSEYQNLVEKEYLNSQIFHSTNEAAILTDTQFNILDVNKTFCNITGFTREEAGRNGLNFIQTDSIPLLSTDFEQVLIKKGEWSGEINCTRKNGQPYCIWLTIRSLKNKKRNISHYLCTFSDISAIKRTEEHLFHLVYYDKLTGAANGQLFKERLDQALIQAERTNNHCAVVFLDLDGFKLINKTLGHINGDHLLAKVATRIKNCLRDSDTLGRMGGDNFMIILNNLKSPLNIVPIVQKIIRCFQQPFIVTAQEIFMTASLGIALYPEDGDNNESLMKNADSAMHKAKEMGKNTYRFYSPELNDQTFERMLLSNMLRKGVEQNEFIVYYQPQFDIETQQLCSVEALVRWQSKEQGLLSPYKFIQIAEETGLIVPIGEMVLRQACIQGKYWQKIGLPRFKISINLSARQFQQQDIVRMIQLVVEETGFDARFLEFEITESILIEDNIPEVINTLTTLKAMGASIVIDDFGTGYSSLSYLKRFPIDKLKIDKAFIQDIEEYQNNSALAAAIIALGKSLKLLITAEGVETENQLLFLKERGCHQVQGFLFSPPVPASEVEALFTK